MHGAGLRAMSFGVEAVSPATLKKVGRRPIPEAHQRAIVAHCRKLGIVTAAFYVLGFLEDTGTRSARRSTTRRSSGSTVAQFKILTPYPGTPLFKRMEPLVTETRLGAVRRLHADVQSSEPDAVTSCSTCSARRTPGSTCGRRTSPNYLRISSAARSAAWSVASTRGSTRLHARRETAEMSRLGVMLTAISRYGARVLPHDAGADRGDRATRASSSTARTSRSSSARSPAGSAPACTRSSTSYGRMAFYYILKALDLSGRAARSSCPRSPSG